MNYTDPTYCIHIDWFFGTCDPKTKDVSRFMIENIIKDIEQTGPKGGSGLTYVINGIYPSPAVLYS